MNNFEIGPISSYLKQMLEIASALISIEGFLVSKVETNKLEKMEKRTDFW